MPKIHRVLFALVLVLFCVSCHRSREEGLNPGNDAPSIDIPGIEGQKVTLAELEGKVVLVNFWATWCTPCVAELPALQRVYDKLKDRGFVVFAVGIDDAVDSFKEFRDEYKLNFPIGMDKEGSVKSRYKLAGVPESFLVDRKGKIVMFEDPQGEGGPSTRIIGPREWDAPNMIAAIEKLLAS